MTIQSNTAAGAASNGQPELTAAERADLIDEIRRGKAAALKLGLPPGPGPFALDDEAEADEPGLPGTDICGHISEFTYPPGLVGRLIDWMEATAERPKRALYLGAALAFVGTLAGRKFASPTDLRTNLYLVTLAPSGHGKDHAIRKIGLPAEAAGLSRYIGPGRLMSASGLRRLVSREPAVLLMMDEFASLMRQIHDRRAGLHNQMIKHDLLDLFSSAATFFAGAEYAGEAATRVAAPNVSISGTSTPEDYWGSLTALSTMDGLLARMILINVDGPKSDRRTPAVDPRHVPADLIADCQKLVEAGGRGNLGAIHPTAPLARVVRFDEAGAAALACFSDHIDKVEEECPHSPLTRAREHAIKLALTVAVGVNMDEPVISAEIFEWASRLALLSATTLVHEAQDRIADNDREAAYNKILGLIRKHGGKGISEGRLADRCRGIDKRMRDQILDDLQRSGRVRKLRSETGRPGRPSEPFVAAEFARSLGSQK